jgi:1-acyl-sn-glycerol-3-phosphate acyltransferase
MADGERPGGANGAGPRLRSYRSGARRATRFATPGEIAQRLSQLEQQVEAALAGTRLPEAVGLRGTLDDALAAYAGWRRLVFPDGPATEIGELGLRALYRYWWRVDAKGLERIPSRGRVLLVSNRAGALLPFDAFMIGVALAADHPTGRRARPLVDEWVTDLPVVGPTLGRLGALPATPRSLRRVLGDEQAAIVFPEGQDACAKPFNRRYRLGRFGRGALLRVALEMRTPIVPIAVIGAEEIQPVLWRLESLGRPLGLPAIPVTPTFPLLGLFGLVPLPTKWTIHVGEPIDTAATFPAGVTDAVTVRRLREALRERLQGLVTEGLRRRRSIFLG